MADIEQRARFESWVRENCTSLSWCPDPWKVWQAALAAQA